MFSTHYSHPRNNITFDSNTTITMENENKYRLPEEQKFEVFGQMMTEAEYDAWVENNIASSQPKVSNQLLEACLFSDLEGIKDGLKEVSDRSVLEDVNLYSIPTPLYHLTLLNQMVFDTEYWTDIDEDKQAAVAWMEERTKRVIDFWLEFYGVDELPQPKYEDYTIDDFFCAMLEDDDEEILDAPKEAFIQHGCREIDVDLYLATDRFQFNKAEALLKQGANPCAELHYSGNPDHGDWAYHRIGAEVVFLALELLPLYKEAFDGQTPTLHGDEYRDLLGLAEHVKMEKLFEKYCHIWDNNDDKESI